MLKLKSITALAGLALTALMTYSAQADEPSCGFLNVAYAFNSPSKEQCVAEAVNRALLHQTTQEGWDLSNMQYAVDVQSVRNTRERNFTFRLDPPASIAAGVPTFSGWVRLNAITAYYYTDPQTGANHWNYDCSINIGASPEASRTNLILQNTQGERIMVLRQERLQVCTL